jgi:nucleotide-binding universal stress UspA family protein
MLRTILVPLDGSVFSEQALPVALRIAARTDARIELLHAYEHPLTSVYGGRASVRDPRTEAERRALHEAYLPALAERLRSSTPTQVDFRMPEGQTVRRIVEAADQPDVDLVVMTTHGRTGLSRMWLGSVADAVVRGSSKPVLLVRPPTSAHAAPVAEFARVLVPLDGSLVAEEALNEAVAIAGIDAEYQVLQVVPPFEPPAVSELGIAAAVGRPDGEDRASTYLDYVTADAASRGIRASHRVVSGRQIARAILTAAAEWGSDLVAMTTHGRKGVGRILLGSVAEKVVHSAHIPVLVVRPLFDRAADEIEEIETDEVHR